MNSILFVCRGNIYRSPIAKYYLLKLLSNMPEDKNINVDSAGTWASTDISVTSILKRYAESKNINLDQHYSKGIEDIDLKIFDKIIVMEEGQKEALIVEFNSVSERIKLLSDFSGQKYDIPDPVGMNEDQITQILDEVVDLIDSGLEEILK